MKIGKFMCHPGVDFLLYEALGSDLTIYRVGDLYWWLKDEDFRFPLISGYPENSDEFDVFIVDDLATYDAYVKAKIETQQVVWYCHGTYVTWEEFQEFANRNFVDMHVMFTDIYRRGQVLSWFRNVFKSELILPLHLPDSYYTDCSESRNGKCFMMDNRFLLICSIYHNFDIVVETIERLKRLGPDKFHLFGRNSLEDLRHKFVDIPVDYWKGYSSPIRKHMRDYSASIHPSHVRSLGFIPLECMAAGVPVIIAPRDDLPEKFNDKCYVIARSADDFVHWAEYLMSNPEVASEMGRKGQEFLTRAFPFEKYKEKLQGWFESVVRAF